MKRKFKQCEWCGTTIDVTNNDDDLCSNCSQYNSKREMIKNN